MSASSGTTLISPTNTTAVEPKQQAAAQAQAARKTHTRYNSHGHGHHVHHAGGGHAHPTRRSSRSSRRSSEGEHGRRALAAGLTMHALDRPRRKESRESGGSGVAMQRSASASAGASASASDAAAQSSTSASASGEPQTQPQLGRTPSNTSVLSSESGRRSDRGRRDESTIEVIAGPEGDGDDGEWESGEETPAPKRVAPPPPGRAGAGAGAPGEGSKRDLGTKSEDEHRDGNDDEHKDDDEGDKADSPLDLRRPPRSPKHDAKERTTGFPGTPTPLQTPSAPSTGPGSQPASRAGSRRPSLSTRSQSRISLTRPTDSTTSLSSLALADKAREKEPEDKEGAANKPAETVKPKQKQREPGEYPFPRMEGDAPPAKQPSEVKRRDMADGAVAGGPSQESESAADRRAKDTSNDTLTKDTAAKDTPHAEADHLLTDAPVRGSPESYEVPAAEPERPDPERTATLKSAATLPRPPSISSLRSIQSLRAPPHPLNSPTGRSGFLDGASPRKRVASLHYPPAAPAVVNCETVSGHGYAPTAPPRPAHRGSSGRSHRTAAQAAQAAARLNTTTDPVAYHHSLGFSHATAETAHLLSRFLPPAKQRRPRWAISTREALAAHEAVAEGRDPELRVGLTDGQYREAHEALVATLKELGKRRGARRSVPKSYSYQALLGGVGAEELAVSQAVPRRRASGQTPFEMSVNRCLAQRN